LLVLLIAGVLVVPGMIDWNHYKGDIQAQAKALTGRDLMISGDIKITVLPAPALIAGGVALANVQGASSPHLARLKLLEVRIALAPLLAGRVEVKRIKLVDPVIELEALADGRKNWTFDAGRGSTAAVPPAPGTPSAPPAVPTAPPATTTAAPASAPASTGAARIAFENFTITNGTLIYRDAKAGTVERVEQITANFSAASLAGPFESGGSLKLRGLPLRYDVNVGDIIQGRTVPFNLKLGMAPGDAMLQMVGTAVGLESAPKIKGKVKGSGASLARLIEAAQPGTALPAFLNQDFSFEGTVAGAVDGATVKDLALRFGNTQATGEITVDTGKALTVATRIAAGRVDLDKWLAIADAPAAGAASQQAAKGSTTLPPAKPAASAAAAFAIPRDVSGSLAFSAEAVTFRGGLIKHAVFNAELNNGEITVSQLSAQFPGGSDLAVFGFVTAAEGQPRFEGELESTVNDFHGVMKWLGNDVDGLAPDRLRKLTLATRVAASPKQAEFRNLDLQFDSSRLTGGLTVALTKRPSFGADITLDRLNLDAYLPEASAKPAKLAAGAPAATTKKPAVGQAAAPAAAAKTDNPLVALKPLTAFDANLKARVNTLVLRGNQIKDVTFDGTLYTGRLEIRRLAVAKMAGAAASVAGTVDKLGGQPTAAGLKFDVTADDLPRFLRFAGMNPPVPSKDLGVVAVKGRLDGALTAPRVNLRVEGAGASAAVDGQIDGLDAIPAARKLKFQLTAGDAARVLRLAGIDAPAAKSLGAISAAGELDG
ncbi:MAG: AsmA family protein, partial [Rhodospirillales bacterium]|nr:AsmA family protein [Rhodospirillales bacterium]